MILTLKRNQHVGTHPVQQVATPLELLSKRPITDWVQRTSTCRVCTKDYKAYYRLWNMWRCPNTLVYEGLCGDSYCEGCDGRCPNTFYHVVCTKRLVLWRVGWKVVQGVPMLCSGWRVWVTVLLSLSLRQMSVFWHKKHIFTRMWGSTYFERRLRSATEPRCPCLSVFFARYWSFFSPRRSCCPGLLLSIFRVWLP